jgi:hypothetical protein
MARSGPLPASSLIPDWSATMSLADGFGWLQCRSDHARRFGVQVPDWICCYDLPQRIRLVRCALRIGWALPERVLIPDEFHSGRWSVWG